MDLVWRNIFRLSIGLLILILHKWIGKNSKPLTKSNKPRKEIIETLFLWSVAVKVLVVRMFVLAPWFSRFIDQRFFLELAYVPILTISYIVLPLYIVMFRDKWTTIELGLT